MREELPTQHHITTLIHWYLPQTPAHPSPSSLTLDYWGWPTSSPTVQGIGAMVYNAIYDKLCLKHSVAACKNDLLDRSVANTDLELLQAIL